MKFERLHSAESVRFLTNCAAYIPREWVDDEENFTWNYFIGFEATDVTAGPLGEIIDIDDSTINTLFVIEDGGEERLVPINEDFIKNIDHENRTITLELPEGLIEL